MRILIFHGYLLAGTGSNVYNARLAEALVKLGHEVHLFCQDRHPRRQAFVGAAGDWDSGELRVSALGPARGEGPRGEGLQGSGFGGGRSQADGSPRCTTYRPDIGGLLPVYVLDPYEGIEAKTFAQCSEAEVAAYIQANVEAVREVAELVRPDVALANHLVMSPVILARALGGDTPYAVKIHGSALEYTVKPQPERFLPFAREGLEQARTVLVGSKHTGESLWAALGGEFGAQVKRRTRLGPPGVDVERFVPREWHEAEETVVFVGKLIAAKGIDLLIAAWPLVLQRRPNARLLVVGFGSWREQVEDLCRLLGQGELERAESIALPYLLAFLRGLEGGERERYASVARRLADRIVFAGRLDHEQLADVLPACEALVVPSTFPEAFGMVAAEAAACGVLPISAAHSGLAEVSEVIAGEIPEPAAAWLSFPIDEGAVRAIAERVLAWLGADRSLKERTRAALVSVARERWSWEGVARGVIAAARGEPETHE
jgi:glycosyltransferase involved in cell wall biosynthesis